MLNPPSLQNNTTNVVIQQNSRKLLMMDILMSETCWNTLRSEIKQQVTSSWSLILQQFYNNLHALVGQIKDLILSTCTVQLRRSLNPH